MGSFRKGAKGTHAHTWRNSSSSSYWSLHAATLCKGWKFQKVDCGHPVLTFRLELQAKNRASSLAFVHQLENHNAQPHFVQVQGVLRMWRVFGQAVISLILLGFLFFSLYQQTLRLSMASGEVYVFR